MKRFKGTAQDVLDFVRERDLDPFDRDDVLECWLANEPFDTETEPLKAWDTEYFSWLEARYGKTMAELDEELGEEIG